MHGIADGSRRVSVTLCNGKLTRALLPRSAAVLLALALAGCANLSVSPSGGKYASPVTVSVSSGADIEIGSLRASVDGVDQTAAFSFARYGTRSLDASLTLAAGMHTVQATANVWNSYDRRYDPKSAQATFEVGPPGSIALAISPAAVAVLPGGAATINLVVTRAGSFAGEVRVSEAYSVPGETTLSVLDSTGTIAVTARADAVPGDGRRTINASGHLFSGMVSDQQTLTFRIGHRAGVFSRATYAARSAGQSMTGPDNQTTLTVENGPPMGARFEARFRRPSNSLGATVGFEPGAPVVGGAGFCATGSAGFVMSGGSTTGPHALTMVLPDDAFVRIPLAPIVASVPNGPVVTPEVFFSRDCAVVITVGADPQLQATYRATAYDMNQRRTLCSLSFNALPSTLQAELLGPIADNQVLRVSVGSQTTTCNVF